MSKSERRSIKIGDTKEQVFAFCGWRCVFVDEDGNRCPKPATEVAHILPQDVVHLERYGAAVIHHTLNLRGTCPKHNASVQINARSRPLEADRHAAAIERKIEEDRNAE